MIEQDTVKLLRECDAGVKMGIRSLDDVMDAVQCKELSQALEKAKTEHRVLEGEIEGQLNRFSDEGKEPGMVAKGMSHVKTSVMLAVEPGDETVADLITDGCNMGVKSLCRYLNQYKAADEYAKDITKRLIKIEKDLCEEMQSYL